MEKSTKPLTRDALIDMQVIDARGQVVGKVKDVVFAVGKMGISISVDCDDGETKTIGWEDVQAAGDVIILKPVQQATQTTQQSTMQSQQQTQPTCPTCGRPLTWIPQYQRWYCYNDKKYV